MGTKHLITSSLSAVALSACAAGAPVEIASLQDDVGPSQKGAEVHAVQEYLRTYGYFDDPELAEEYPHMRPVIGDEPEYGEYDAVTEAAVREFQEGMGLAPTGMVDAATRRLMAKPRCGFPDGAFEPVDEDLEGQRKFALSGKSWSDKTLTWKLTNTDDLTRTEIETALTNAFAQWVQVTNISFAKTTGTPDISISFTTIDGAGKKLATGAYPTSGRLKFDKAETWSVASTPPSGTKDLRAVAVHEIGHVIGLAHSSVSGATMFPYYFVGAKSLAYDDKMAIGALYDEWDHLPGSANDIGMGTLGTPWVIGRNSEAGGYGVYYFQPVSRTWTKVPGSAVRIAVAGTNTPWVVNNAGQIFQRTYNGWTYIPGCARDIGAGKDGSVWVIGCNSVGGGYQIFKRENGGWTLAPGGAERISVSPSGVPWVVQSNGAIFRRTGSSPIFGSWEAMPGAAKDIGVGPDGAVYAIGTNARSGDYGILLWNEQTSIPDKADAKEGWVVLPGGATDVAGGWRGPLVVNDGHAIFRRKR